MRQYDRERFFDVVRKDIFGGSLTQKQVDNLNEILRAIEAEQIWNPFHAAAVLATARIEVGSNMAPVREGFAATDAGARRAVQRLYDTGKISRNYAAPDPVTGKSYYGRGYPQTTHKENYLKSGTVLGVGDLFVHNPDLLLQPYWSARTMAAMMARGLYTGLSLTEALGTGVPSHTQLVNSRAIINGDKNKRRRGAKQTIGEEYAAFVQKFSKALRIVEVPGVKPPVTEPGIDKPASESYVSRMWARLKAWLKSMFI